MVRTSMTEQARQGDNWGKIGRQLREQEGSVALTDKVTTGTLPVSP